MKSKSKKTFLITTTLSALHDDYEKFTSMQKYCTDYNIHILLSDAMETDEKPDSLYPNCIILDGREIITDRYYLKAFTFIEQEFKDYLSLAASLYLLANGYENIILINRNTSILSTLDNLVEYDYTLQDTIWLLHTDLSSRMIDDNSSTKLLSDKLNHNLQSCIFINHGERVFSFLKWCVRQYETTYYQSTNLYLRILPDGKITRENGLCTLQNILIKNLYHLNIYKAIRKWEQCIIFDKKEDTHTYQFNYFMNKVPVNFTIRNIFSSPYAIADMNIINPFNAHEALLSQSVVYENKKIIPITSTMQMIYDHRLDLQQAFPNYRTSDRPRYAEWYIHNAAKEFKLSPEYIEPITQAYLEFTSNTNQSKIGKILNKIKESNTHTTYPFGVNLCGFISGDFGLAEATRLLAKTLDSANIPFTIVSYSGSAYHTKNNNEWAHKITNEFIYSVNIMLTGGKGAIQFPSVTSPDMYLNRYNIGYWYWELPEFYDAWDDSFRYIDEVWTSSEFSRESFAAKTMKPVKVMPLCMNVVVDENYGRKNFGIPEDKFVFLMMYDVRSIQKRKNPQAAVESFINEFAENENAILAIKINAPSDWNGENELLNSISHLKNVITIKQTFTKPVVNSLIKCCDVYVSLHRSEGLGLGPAESMYLGRPAIMTGWSGNMAYSTQDNSCLVDYEIVELEEDYPPYQKGCHWAEPSIKSASTYMRRLFEDKEYYDKIASNGYKTMHEDFDAKHLGLHIEKRLKEVQKDITDTVYKNLIK